MAATGNSKWHTPTPFSVQAPSYSGELPTEILDDVENPVVTLIEVLDAPLFVNLDGTPVTTSSYDFKLDPMTDGAMNRYRFVTSPDLILMISSGGSSRVKIGFEEGLIGGYTMYRPVYKVFTTVPITSSQLPLGLINNSSDIYRTIMQISGPDPVYITLDGRDVSDTDYDFKLGENASESLADAYVFNVAPSKIRILGDASTSYKVAYEQFPADVEDWAENPLYSDAFGFG